MAKKKGTAIKKDTWLRDSYGTSKKMESSIKTRGGNEWDIAGFRNYMDYRTARQTQMDTSNSTATSNFNKAHEKSYKKQQEKEQNSLQAEIKKSEQQRKQRKLEQERKKQQDKGGFQAKSFGHYLTHPKDYLNDVYDGLDVLNKTLPKPFSELMRFRDRAGDSASFGLLGETQKAVTDKEAYYRNQEGRTGGEKALDFAGTGLGYIAPSTALYKGLNATKLGKGLTEFGGKSLTKRLATESVKGAAIGAGLSAPEIGLKELLNPNDQNYKDNLKYFGMNTALGAVADPALYGLGKGISKGFQSAANSSMRNLLPKNEVVASEFANAHKTFNAGPNAKPNPFALNDLIPRGNDITNPSFLPKLNPPKTSNVHVPKIGNPADTLPPMSEESLSLLERLQMTEGNRALPDFSTAQPSVVKSPSLLPELLSGKPNERTLPDFSYGKQTSEPIKPVNQYGVEVPFDKVEHAPTSYWRGRYEEFADFVNQNYNSNQLNKEALDDLWSQFAKYDEPVTLDEVVDLAYRTTKEAPVLDARNVNLDRPPVSKKAQDIMGVNESAFKLPEPGKPIDTAEVWDKMGNRPPVSKNAQKIIMGGGKPKKTSAPPSLELLHRLNETTPGAKPEGPVPPLQPPKTHPPVSEPVTLKTIQTKPLHEMSPDELTKVHEDLVKEQNISVLMGENPKAFNEDIAKVEQVMNDKKPPVTQAEAPQVPKQEAPVKQQETPKKEPKKSNERSFPNTVLGSDKLTPEVRARIEQFDKGYTPMKNKELVQQTNEYIAGNGIDKSYQFVKNAKKLDPRHIAVGQRLIDELSKAKGQEDKVIDLIEKLSTSATSHGQAVQSYSLYNKLSVEGQLLRVQRHINRINEDVTNPKKMVSLTEKHVEDITHSAEGIKRFTGQEEMANDVIKIMDSIKKGNVATDAELETVRSFVSDAKKFVADLEPGAPPKQPKVPKDVRTRDKVVDFMDAREQVARERIRKAMNRANSLPVDMFYDLSIIGASKIAKGTIKVADFTEEIVKEFGEKVRPYANQIYNKAVETFNLQSESMTRQRLSEVEKITNTALKDKNLSADQADSIREFARQVGLMSGDAKLEASMELQTTLQLLERPTFLRRVATTQTIGQLLNPKTIVRNAIGNEMFYRVEQINKLVATPVDIVRSKITGGERTITFRTNNQGQYWKNFMTGGKAGWKGVNPMGLQTAYDLGPQAFRSKWNPMTYLEKSLGATLRSFDHAAYMRAYNNTLGELATLKAVNQGLKGQAKKDAIKQFIREADENMVAMADQYGKYTTFQDSTVLSTGLQKVKKAMNFKKEFGLGDMILKYPKTPGNLVMRALEYSPVGVLRSAYLIKQAWKAENSQLTRSATESLTRAIIGTGGFSILGYFLADAGVLTANGNSDYEIANLEKMAGKQANSVNVSALNRFIASGFNPKKAGTQKGDTFWSYDWAQPVSIAMSLGSGINQSKKEKGELSGGDAVKGALDSAANTVINQSVLKGLNDFLANYPGRTMSDRFADVGKGLPSSFTPTLLNQIRQKNSNASRTTYDNTISGETKNRVMNRIPGLDSKLPPSYDTLGNKRETYQGGTNSLLNVFLNPSFVSKYDPSPEADALLNYINETGDKRAAPRMADKKLDGIKLTGGQYAELQRLIGSETKKGLQDLLPRLKDPNDPDISKDIYKLLNDSGKTGRGEIRKQIVTPEQLAEAKKKYGLDANTVYDRLKKGKTLNWALTTPVK